MVKCGTLDTGEFIEDFCFYPELIDTWDKNPPGRFVIFIHHANGNHHENQPENRMTCHSSCHSAHHNRSSNHLTKSYSKLLYWVKLAIKISKLTIRTPDFNLLYCHIIDSFDYGCPMLRKNELIKLLEIMCEREDIVKSGGLYDYVLY